MNYLRLTLDCRKYRVGVTGVYCTCKLTLTKASVPATWRAFCRGHYFRLGMVELIGCGTFLLQGQHLYRVPLRHNPKINYDSLTMRDG